MIYLSGGAGPHFADLPPSVGYMVGPKQWNRIPDDGRPRAFDNGCFKRMIGREEWERYLDRNRRRGNDALFAVVPDVYADADATLAQWPEWSVIGRQYGIPLAFVAQNGFDAERVPWGEFNALFIGGDNTFKLAESGGWDAVREGKRRGKWVHVGRVNSWARFAACLAARVDSVDGTLLCFGPEANVGYLRAWQERKRSQPILPLWAGVASLAA